MKRVGPDMMVKGRFSKVLDKKFLLVAILITASVVGVITVLVLSNASRAADRERNELLVASDADKRQQTPLVDTSGEVQAALPLLHRLNENYTRGSQPLQGGIKVLARLGIKTIVDLRSSYEHTDEVRIAAERLGLSYYWHPMSVWNPPIDQEANEFLSVVMDESKGPFFVFCADGLNRTGELTAIYRVMHDKWSVERALKEMDELGFNPYYYNLRNYVWTYARKFRPSAVPPHGRRVSKIEHWEESLKR